MFFQKPSPGSTVFFVCLLFIFGTGDVLAGGTPHYLTGTVNIPGYGAPPNDQVHFKCYLTAFTGNPGDTLIESSLDCNYWDGIYYVQISNFQTAWAAGMDIHIDLWEEAGGGTTFGDTVLTSEVMDVLDLTILDSSLPVELSSFFAEPEQTGISIHWTTQSELQNLGFIIERRNTDNPWEIIASYQTHPALLGQGSTSSATCYEYMDWSVKPGTVYQYRLSDVKSNGLISMLDIIDGTLPEVPVTVILNAPSPNPFNPATRITFQLSEAADVDIIVYDIIGQPVRTLIDGNLAAGTYHIYWHGLNDRGMHASSGTYIVLMKTADSIKMQKALLMR